MLLITMTYVDEEAELVEGQLLVRREDVVAQLDERVVVAPDDVPYRRPIERLNNRINISCQFTRSFGETEDFCQQF
jgi:hypothetical protein